MVFVLCSNQDCEHLVEELRVTVTQMGIIVFTYGSQKTSHRLKN